MLIESVGLIDKGMRWSNYEQINTINYYQSLSISAKDKRLLNLHRMDNWPSLHSWRMQTEIWQLVKYQKWMVSPWIWVGGFAAERLDGLWGEGDGVGVFAGELHLEVELGVRLLLHRGHCRQPFRHYLAPQRRSLSVLGLRPPWPEACSWLKATCGCKAFLLLLHRCCCCVPPQHLPTDTATNSPAILTPTKAKYLEIWLRAKNKWGILEKSIKKVRWTLQSKLMVWNWFLNFVLCSSLEYQKSTAWYYFMVYN